MKAGRVTTVMAMVALMSLAATAMGQIPQRINYQCILTNDSGEFLPHGEYQIRFAIYDAATGGSTLWSETQMVQVDNGLCNVLLGDVTELPLTLFDESSRYLGIKVGSDPEMTPRQLIASVAFAFRAHSVGTGGGGINEIQPGTGINVSNPAGPVTTVSHAFDASDLPNAHHTKTTSASELISGTLAVERLPQDAIDDTQIQDNSLTELSLAENSIGTSELQSQVAFTPLGLVEIGNSSGEMRAQLGINGVDGGILIVDAPDGTDVTRLLGASFGGYISVDASDGTEVATLFSNDGFGGYISVSAADGTEAARVLGIDGLGGYFSTDNSAGTEVSKMSTSTLNGGIIGVTNSAGADVAKMTSNTAEGGAIVVSTADGRKASLVTTGFGIGAEETGHIYVTGRNGNIKAQLVGLPSGVGGVTVFQDDYVEAVRITSNGTGADEAGWLGVRGKQGQDLITLNGQDGSISGTVKNFRIDHPEDPTKEIYYASMEGPEAGVYVRGTARLVSGQVTIQLPDHFSLVATEQGMTIQLTPLSASSEGLAVVSKSTQEIVVKELRNGTGTYEFDYLVHAIRRGYEDYQVVRSKPVRPALVSGVPAVSIATPVSAASAQKAAAVAKEETAADKINAGQKPFKLNKKEKNNE